MSRRHQSGDVSAVELRSPHEATDAAPGCPTALPQQPVSAGVHLGQDEGNASSSDEIQAAHPLT